MASTCRQTLAHKAVEPPLSRSLLRLKQTIRKLVFLFFLVGLLVFVGPGKYQLFFNELFLSY